LITLPQDRTPVTHAGGNITGFSAQSVDLAGKRIEILRELLPDLRQLAVMADAGYSASVLESKHRRASSGLGWTCSQSGVQEISRMRLTRFEAKRRHFMSVRVRW
jgi:ABC-type uncharacterized transport system substrate-binding protein